MFTTDKIYIQFSKVEPLMPTVEVSEAILTYTHFLNLQNNLA